MKSFRYFRGHSLARFGVHVADDPRLTAVRLDKRHKRVDTQRRFEEVVVYWVKGRVQYTQALNHMAHIGVRQELLLLFGDVHCEVHVVGFELGFFERLSQNLNIFVRRSNKEDSCNIRRYLVVDYVFDENICDEKLLL